MGLGYPRVMARVVRTWVDRLIRGDLREVLPRFVEPVADLVYFDPPFGTGRNFGAYDDRREALDLDLAELLPREHAAHAIVSFAPDGIARTWLRFLASCLLPIRRAAKPTATIWLHVDERCGHLARLMCEAILSPARWRSTVVWSYRRWPSPARRFQATHDTLFCFAPEGSTFNVLYDKSSPHTIAKWGDRRQVAVFDEGKRIVSKRGEGRSPGPAMGDVWEIPILAPPGHERKRGSKYPTQKPEALLRRIIESTSKPGDFVLDPACGSGTTLAVANSLRRRWIGIDLGDAAIRACENRLFMLAEDESAEPASSKDRCEKTSDICPSV